MKWLSCTWISPAASFLAVSLCSAQEPAQPEFVPPPPENVSGLLSAPKAPALDAPAESLLGPSNIVGTPWIFLGPAPTRGAQLTVPPSNEVSGAVQAIAAHPTNADIIFVGTVNGGVWRTTNGTSTSPVWTPLTDFQDSSSIGAIEFDPTDPTRQTVVASIGRLSSFGAVGGPRIGVLRTTDGGSNWTVLGSGTFANENLTSVAARGNILMAASDSTWGGGNGSGLFRSINTGSTFVQVSGGSGLSSGPVSDLVSDPLVQSRFFAAVKTVGIFRSDDSGATWTNITGSITGISASTTKIEMAAHNNGSTTALFVGVLNASALSSVWRSTNLGVTWTQMDTPSTGGQGDVHFSIVADPTNSALVYLGGQSGYWRGDATLPSGSQFASIQGSGGGGTTPHADSREMVFDANGNILEGSDGGIYRRVNPQSSSGVWVTVVGNLAVIEAHDVDYDSVAHVAMIGTQDNGTHIQQNTNSLAWLWISGGDGGDVAVDDLSSTNQSVRYGSSQNLGGFYRKTYDAANNLVSTVFPALTLLNGSPAISAQFATPVELNKVDATHLIIGGANYAYESANRGDSVQALTNGGGSVNGTFTGRPVAYGGYLAGVPNTNILYYGSGTSVKVRQNAGDPVSSTAGAFPGSTVQDIVIDTNDWRRVFAIDSAGVYVSSNGGTNWSNITSNLTGAGSLHTLEFFALGGVDCVSVGADAGVFFCYVNDLGNWSRLGSGLPTAPVFDMKFKPRDRVLVVGTMGRGVWLFDTQTLTNAVLAAAGASVVAESCTINNGAIDPGETVTVTFALTNSGTAMTTNLVATLLATGGVIGPSGPQTYGIVAPGGAPVTNTFTFSADGACGGVLTASLQLMDGSKSLGTVNFPFTLGVVAGTNTNSFTATDLISVPNSGDASPYPASNVVSGLSGLVSKVTVTLNNVTHGRSDDLDILLVSPTGQTVMLMSDAGGNNSLSSVNLTFDDAAASALPDSTAISSGTYRPADFEIGETLSAPAPAGPYSTNLSVFNGIAPNGTWQLFVTDDSGGQSGSIGSWALKITTVVTQGCCLDPASVDPGVSITAAPNPVLVGSNLTYTINVSNAGPATATSVTVSNTLPAGATFVSATPSQGSATNSPFNVVASLGSIPAGSSATVTVVVTPTTTGAKSVTARITAAEFDYNIANNTASASATAILPSLTINDVSVTEGNSGTTNAVFTVSLSPAYGQTVTVNFTNVNGTAAAGTDYLATNGTVTFAPGVTNQTITVLVNGDLLNEANETFVINLTNAANAVLADAQGVGTILNDDPLPVIVLTNAAIFEGNTGSNNVSLNVRLSAPSGQTVSFSYATSNGTASAASDYVGKSTNATFGIGVTNITLTFTVFGDVLIESNETFYVVFSTPTNGVFTNTLSAITIINDDGFPGELDHFSFSTISSPQTAFVPFNVTVTARDASNAVVSNYFGPAVLSGSTGSGEIFRADFESGTQGFTFSNNFGSGGGLWHLSTGRANDSGHTPTHSLYYGTNESVAGGGNYDTGNNEGVVISPAINLSNAVAPLTLSFNYLLATEGLSSYDFAYVEISTNNGLTYSNLVNANTTGGPMTNNTGGLWRSASVSLSAYAGKLIRLRFRFDTVDSVANNFEGWYVDDIVISGAITPVAISPAATGAFTNGVWAGPVTVLQNAAGMVVSAGDAGGHTNGSGVFSVVGAVVASVSDASVVEGDAGTTPLTFNVVLSQTNSQNVSVAFATSPGTAAEGVDYLGTNGLLVFTPGQTSKPVVVNIIGDTLSELDETFTFTLSGVTNAVLGDAVATGTILNDDPFLPLSDSPRNDFPVANGAINAFVELNGVVYFGGSFTEVGLTDTGKLVPFFLSTGLPATAETMHAMDFTNQVPPSAGEEEEEEAPGLSPFAIGGWPRVDQTVNIVIADEFGGWYVGGSFTSVGGIPRFRLVHLMPDRSVDAAFVANCNGTVSALWLDETNLYIGGSFTAVTNGGSTFTRNRFAVLDPDTGEVRSLPSDPTFNNSVLAFAFTNDVLYAGGTFTNITTATTTNARSRLAAIDTTTGQPTAFVADADNTVNALALGDGTLYAGGAFNAINGSPAFRIVEVDQSTGTQTAWMPDMNSTVSALFTSNGLVYAGGSFTVVTNNGNTFSRSNLVALNASTGDPSAWNPAPNASVLTIAPAGNLLVVGGTFTNIGGLEDVRRLAAVDVGTGAASPAFDPDPGGTVNSVAVYGNVVYAGGSFSFFKGVLRNRLAAVNAATADLLPWNPDANSTVQALAARGTNIYAGGLFTAIGGVTRTRMAAIDTNGALNTTFAPSFNNTVRALVAGSNALYVGGDFSNYTANAVTWSNRGVAGIDLSTGSSNTPIAPNPILITGSTINVQSLALDGSNLYFGGQFTDAGGQFHKHVARVNVTNGLMDSAWNPQLNSNALAILVRGTNVFLGGQFTSVTNTTGTSSNRNRLVAVNTQSGDFSGWNPNASSTVFALAVRDTNLLAGGQFTTLGGQSRSRLAELPAGTTNSQVRPWNPSMSSDVNAILPVNQRVYAGGAFAAASAQSRAQLAIFEPNSPPILTVPPGTVTFTENGPAVSVAPSLVVNDLNNLTIASATVTIVSNYAAGEDVLGCLTPTGISAAFTGSNGVLTLTGTASIAAYQATLRALTYTNFSDNPTNAPRVVRFTVNDGSADSLPLDINVAVIPVNDPPMIGSVPSVTTVENQLSPAVPFTVGDVDNDVNSLLPSAFGANLLLVPPGSVLFGGSGSNRTLQVLPGINQSGSTLVTVVISDGIDTNSTTFTLTVLVDTDHDGIPDVYELAHGMNLNDASDAAADFDGDGLTNLQEYLAGTDPNDSRNYLGIVAVTIIAPDAQVSFYSVSGKSYLVESTDDLLSGSWSTVATNVPGTGAVLNVLDAGAAAVAQRQYRVRLLP